jgi:hypothetical protein
LKSFVAKMMEKPMKVEMKNQMNFVGFGWCIIVKSVHDTNITTIICNSRMYSKGDTFGISVN